MKKMLICLFLFCTYLCATAEEKPIWALSDVKGTGEFHDGLAQFYDVNKKAKGFINSSGMVAIEAKFKEAEDFQDGQAIVTIEKRGMGIINRNGYYLLDPKYSKIERAEEAPNLYVVTDENNQKGVFFNGRLVIPPIINAVSLSTSNFPFIGNTNILTGEVYEEILKVRNFFMATLSTKNGRITIYFDKNGNEINSDAYKKSSKGIVLFKDEQTNKFGFKNAITGEIVTKPQYLGTQTDIWIDDYIIAYGKEGNELINAEGKPQMKANMLMYEGNDGYFCDVDFSSEDIIYTLYSKELKKIISAQMLYPIFKDWYRCENKKEIFAFNAKTKQKYLGTHFTYGDGMIKVQTENEGYYYFNTTTGKRLKENYKYAYDFREGLAVVEKDGIKQVIDKQGRVVLHSSGDFKITGQHFSEGVLAAENKYENGYIYNPLGTDGYVYNQKGASDKTINHWFDEGIALLNKKKYAEAKELFYRVMLNNPKDGNAINNYGVCLENMGYKEEALEAFTMAYSIDPSNKTAQNNAKLIQQALYQQKNKVKDNSKSATFWDALSSFADVVVQMTGQLTEYQTENSYITAQNMGRTSSSVRAERIKAQRTRTDSLQKESNYRTSGAYKNDDRAYIGWENQLRDMKLNRTTHYSHLNASDYRKKIREIQQKMKSIREKMKQNGVNRSKSSFEDWIP